MSIKKEFNIQQPDPTPTPSPDTVIVTDKGQEFRYRNCSGTKLGSIDTEALQLFISQLTADAPRA